MQGLEPWTRGPLLSSPGLASRCWLHAHSPSVRPPCVGSAAALARLYAVPLSSLVLVHISDGNIWQHRVASTAVRTRRGSNPGLATLAAPWLLMLTM